MSIPAGNDATGASGTGPVLGYNLKLICFFLFNLVLSLNTCTCLVSLTVVMEILFNYIVNFGIKIYRKLPRFLTIQKPDFANRLSVSSFAATIKPPPFDGSNYKRWHERLILWLTVLRVMHVKEGKPE